MMADSNKYQVTNTFSGGMNTDVDKSLLSNNQYIHSKNFRLFSNSLNSVGSKENVIGNTLLSDPEIPIGYYIVGSCNIRDELYLFLTQNTALGQTGYSRIVKVIFNSTGTAVSSMTTIYDDHYSSDSSRLKWNNLQAYKVKAVGRYESDIVKKIYFVDGYNPVRVINVYFTSALSISPVNKFDLIPNFSLSSPIFSSFGTGNLTSGRIQYAYQMYDLNGAETLFSPASPLISISSTSGQTGSNKTFKGTDRDINTGKGIRFSILPPSGFTRIRVVSIKYNAINSIPIINIVADQDISTTPSTTYFYDTGISNLGSYTYEQFAVVGRGIFTGSEIEEKNNYLFIGNITNENWDVDFDARSYRFVASTATGTLTVGHSAIFDSGTWGSNTWYNIYNNFLIDGTTSVLETYDCLNPINDISLDTSIRTNSSPLYVYLYYFIYQVNGTKLGGSGLNVSYEFVQDHEIIISDPGGTTYNEDFCYNTDYSNTNVEVTYTGYQRDEVYRFGLIFYDEKGRQSTVKWIGDIRFPYYGNSYTPGVGELGTSNYSPFFNITGTSYARPLGIKFTIDTTTAYSQGARYFKIVRAKRTITDRNILAQGVTPTLILLDTAYRGYVIPYTGITTVGGVTKYPTMLEFISPEVNFNKNLEFANGDSIEYIGHSQTEGQWDNFSNVAVSVGAHPTSTNYSYTIKYGGLEHTIIIPGLSNRTTRISLITSSLLFGVLSKSTDFTYLDGTSMYGVDYKVLNVPESTLYSDVYYGLGGTKVIIKTTSTLNSFNISDYAAFYCNYKRNVFNSQYGGNTYIARQFTNYIDCGVVQLCYSSGSYSQISTVYGGDTYIGMFDYLRNIVNGEISEINRSQLVMYFPVETSINLRYRQDDCYSKSYDDTNHSRRLMQELAGVYISGIVSYNQTVDLYKYNSVYSQENTTRSYFQESTLTPELTEIHDNRIMVSELKINGETTDNWTVFKLDNFLDVDSQYGIITTLLQKDNNLYFWQPKAFGVLSVNQRSLIQDNNYGQLVLGTGGILDRYDYISTNEGCNYRFSVVEGLKGLYWFDSNNHGIYRYSEEGVQSLSKLKGVSSFIKNSVTLNSETISIFDKIYNEVLFTLPVTSECFVFNEIFDSFDGVYTFYPNSFIKPNGSIYYLSTNRTTRDLLYMHDIGNRGQFYGTYYPSSIKLIINDNYNYTKVFDCLQYNSTCENSSGTNQIYGTFNLIRVYNDHQNSDYHTIYTTGSNKNIDRPEREFILSIPRNRVTLGSLDNINIFDPTYLEEGRQFKERMRDKYIIIDLSYTNSSNNYIFKIPYITTNYRISKR